MRIDIITVLPELLKSPFEASILKRAIEKGLVEVHLHNLRDFATNSYNQIDDYQFGGGAGMVMMIEPIDKCISGLKAERAYDEVIYMTPEGQLAKQLNTKIAAEVYPFQKFWVAEDYHQNYERLHPENPYIQNVSIPRLNRFKAKFPELLKSKH